jgi:hypothetical protein
MKTYDWSIFRYYRWGSIIFMLGFPILGVLISEYLTKASWVFILLTLIYGFTTYYLFLRPLFRLLCPICGKQFFAQPGSYIWFVRCENCQARIGDQKSA